MDATMVTEYIEEATQRLCEATALIDVIQCTYGVDGFSASDQTIMATLTIITRIIEEAVLELEMKDHEPLEKPRGIPSRIRATG